MYLPESKCLFVHIPKTAGNSIMKAFGVGWDDHRDLLAYREQLGEAVLQAAFKFAFVRNPWGRVLSEYNFQRRKTRRRDTVRLYLHKPDGAVRSFREWVEFALSHPDAHQPKEWGGRPSAGIHRMSPQWDWIALDGTMGADFVGRMESIHVAFGIVCDRLEVPRRRIPRRNWKFHWNYRWYYDDETRERVTEYYRKDIETFGYTFGK